MEIRLSARTEKDLENIFSYTETIWGMARRRRTALQLNEVFDFLAHNPESGRETARAGVFVLVVPRLPYVLLYRKNNSAVTILQLIHTKRRR